MPDLVVVLGPPGSGKGTQCAALAERTGFVHLSTGDLLRDEMRRGSALGRAVRDAVDAGRLVDDDVVLQLVHARVQDHHHAPVILLDGFPRTLTQAGELFSVFPTSIKLAIELVVPFEVLTRRLLRRGRVDDTPEVVRRRLVGYARDTWPLLRWLSWRGLLVPIDGNRAAPTVTGSLHAQLVSAGMVAESVPVTV